MPSSLDVGDFSDSDGEDLVAELETDVLLGLPDGEIKTASDLVDAAVSRIGGFPALLPTHEPSISSSQCKNCSFPMPLLVQLWCPLENSEMDRALYVWGCARTKCQKKEGSMRAWRGLRFNAEYAKKLKKKEEAAAAKRAAIEKEAAKRAEQQSRGKVNPFKMTSNTVPNPFTWGTQTFGTNTATAETVSVESAKEADTEDTLLSTKESPLDPGDEEDLVIALASTTLEESVWKSAPSYRPLYLTTTGEYVPPPPKTKTPQVSDGLDDEPGGNGAVGVEAYENSMETDHVFDRFSKRVSYEGEQCIRYELGGVPLPYAKDKVFERLFPVPETSIMSVTKSAFAATTSATRRTYSADGLPPCPRCKASRVFECQLMPNLINVLIPAADEVAVGTKDAQTDEERRKEVERLLQGASAADSDGPGMDWGTCMIFSCSKDCSVSEEVVDAEECWCEELVLVQWDD